MSIDNQCSSRKFSIAFVSREFPPSKRLGGIGIYVWETATYLAQLGHSVYVIAASDDIDVGSNYSVEGVTVIRLPGGDFYLSDKQSWFSKLYSYWRSFLHYKGYRNKIANCLNQLITEHGVDLVEFPEFGNESLMWSNLNLPTPWLIRLHGSTFLDRSIAGRITFFKNPSSWLFGKLEMANLHKASAVTSCGKDIARLEANFAGFQFDKITIIPNSINFHEIETNLVSLSAKNISLESSDVLPELHLFSAGSVTEGKGYGELVEATLKLRLEWQMEISLTIAGRWGSLGRELAFKAKHDLNYSSWLNLTGAVSREKLFSFYANSDLVVFPSWYEPFGLVCIEAMATGALVIGSSRGGMSEIIEDGVTGFLVEPRSICKLAEKIRTVLSYSDDTLDGIRAKAFSAVRVRYGIDQIMEAQIKLYETLIASQTENKNDKRIYRHDKNFVRCKSDGDGC